MTDEQKQKWIDAGLGVKPDAEVAVTMGLAGRQRVQQVRKLLGVRAWAKSAAEDHRKHLATEIATCDSPGVADFCARHGTSYTLVRDIERETGVVVPRKGHDKPFLISQEQILAAVRKTGNIQQAAKRLGIHVNNLHRYIRKRKMRDIVNTIVLARGGRVLRGIQNQ